MLKAFLIDKQTRRDLQLHELAGKSIWSFFDEALTEGGENFMRMLFDNPVADIDEIKKRQDRIKRLDPVVGEEFMFYRVVMKDMEKFVKRQHSGQKPSVNLLDIFSVKTPVFYYKKRSILEIADFLLRSHEFYSKVNRHSNHEDISKMIDILEVCLSAIFKNKVRDVSKLKLNIFNIDTFDRLIRYELANKIKTAIEFFYEIDANFALAKIAKREGFCYPEIYPKNQTGKIQMEEAYHIFYKNPVKNSFEMDRDKRIWFLTGANMAGKSSFIKTISTVLYLTHIGFPVPARSVTTDLIDGLFTSINLQDNLELGYSHFYVEAIRLKEIVEQLNQRTNALIILDELFKGTNHQDASNAILDILQNFSQFDGPFLIVSSHITELAHQLKDLPYLDFRKMNIESDSDGHPKFTYKIVDGISEEKLGMWLLKKSGVFESIDRLKKLAPTEGRWYNQNNR